MADFLSKVIKSIFGSKSDRDAKEVRPMVDKCLAIYPEISKLSNDQLRERSQSLMKKIADAIAEDENTISNLKADLKNPELLISDKEKIATKIEELNNRVKVTIEQVNHDILPEAFAIIKDTARRFTENQIVEVTASQFDKDLAAKRDFVTIDDQKALYSNSWTAGGNTINWAMTHYNSQLFGGVVLHSGKIAEMATGEGKTLVATLPVFLNALSRKGVHVVTVNDYLAKRDSEWMGPIFQFHGLSVDCIDKHQPHSEGRHAAYRSDITYGTNNEFGFDYLRDNMASSIGERVQREHNYAIVDEVDSVLIDDARTPLIISGPIPKGDNQMYDQYNTPIKSLFQMQKSFATQTLAQARKLIGDGNTDEGGVLLFTVYKALPKYTPFIKFLSEPGMKALLLKTENIYTANKNERMHEVTEQLWFVIDEKANSADLTTMGHEYMSKVFNEPNFFVLPEVGSEVASITKMDISEDEKQQKKDTLLADYSLKSERVHTVNQLLKAYAVFEKDVEYVVLENKVKIVDEQTGRIMEGRRYSDGLHQAIEAKEGVKVEAATQTFATITLQNYFRMYNKLSGMTGTAETESTEFWNIYELDVVVIPTNRPVIRKDNDDALYKTKREKYTAVIEEVEKLVSQGRPVLVGTASVETSELLSKMMKMRNIPHNVLNAKQHQSEAMVVKEAGQRGQVTIATNMAGRGTDIKLSDEVKQAGGLAILGTERHESRRMDRQLRGRSGRQGDPGSSQFFISFEDDLMRLFGSDRIIKIVDRLGMKPGETLQSGVLNNAIGKAQQKVEENNFGVRKRLLEYDDALNTQRKVIYTRRNSAMDGEMLDIDINNIIQDFSSDFIQNCSGMKHEDFNLELIRELSLESPFADEQYEKMSQEELSDSLADYIYNRYAAKCDLIAKETFPVLQSINERHTGAVEFVAVPFSDGKRLFNVRVNMARVIENEGVEVFREFSKMAILITIDEKWKEHLRNMDDLRQSVQNATYEQKDPLLIYKLESFNLFSSLVSEINRDIISLLIMGRIPLRTEDSERQLADTEAKRTKLTDMNKLQENRRDVAAAAGQSEQSKPSPVKVEKRVGRNEPCPCGSGKKYKHCHGA